MATHARQQYFADESSLSKEKREFSIAEEVQQKIDGIEEGAQVNTIETIKVNGSEVQPDENKAVDLTIPGVVDSLDSTSSTDALSARQGKVLYDYIQDVSHIGHFLALWNASTGLPVTDPETSPYIYNTGDFYTVSVVAPQGGTNYKPDGTQYVIGQASTAVDTDDVEVNDFYFYDGQVWRHMKNSGAGSIAIDGSLSTTSTNPVENRVITNALNGKADSTDVNTKTFYLRDINDLTTAQEAIDRLVAGNNPIIKFGNEVFLLSSAYSGSARFASSPYFGNGSTGVTQYLEEVIDFTMSNRTVTSLSNYGINSVNYLDTLHTPTGTFIPTYDWQPASKKYVDDNAGTTYTAGANIQISNENVISATDTKYTAGTGISIDANNVISNTQPGPVISATAPSNPSEGDLWYDTTNDALKSYDGTNWGEGSNVKAFFITNMGSSAAALAEAQPIYDWYIAGKEPIVIYRNTAYILRRYQTGTISFISSEIQTEQQSSISRLYYYIININYDGTGAVTSSGQSTLTKESILETNRNYSTPYTPQYDGSPATKKYVDDSISAISITPSWGDITGTLSDQTDLQNALDAKANVTDVNTKTFTLPSSLSSQEAITVAQEAFDRHLNGKTPILRHGNRIYVCVGYSRSGGSTPSYWLDFNNVRIGTGTVDGEDYVYPSSVGEDIIRLTYDNSTNVVSQVENVYINKQFLPANSTTQVQYTPTRNRDPATKKYVDDQVSAATAGAVSDTAYGSSWDGVTGIAPSKNAVYDKINAIDTTIATDVNTKTFYLSSTSDLTTAQAVYDYLDDGNNPILNYNGTIYTYWRSTPGGNSIGFRSSRINSIVAQGGDVSNITIDYVTINASDGTVYSITAAQDLPAANYLDTDYDYTTPYTPLYNGSPATKKYVDDNANTKTFYLSSTSDLTTAQAILDWYNAGKNPIIVYNNGVKPNTYTIFNKTSTRIDFRGEETPNDTTDHTQLKYNLLAINFSGTTASSISLSTVNQNYLATDISYPSAYIPTYDSSPATKKYVDDKSATVMTASEYSQVSDPVAGKIYFIKES